jgi:hypothetical protein
MKWRLDPFTNEILLTYTMSQLPLLWSSGHISWLQIQRSGFNSRHYQIFWEVVGLEWVPLSLVSIIVELLGRKSSSSGLEMQEYGCRDQSRWPCGTLYLQKLPLTSLRGSRSVRIVRSRTQAMEFSFYTMSQATACHFLYEYITSVLTWKVRFLGKQRTYIACLTNPIIVLSVQFLLHRWCYQ